MEAMLVLYGDSTAEPDLEKVFSPTPCMNDEKYSEWSGSADYVGIWHGGDLLRRLDVPHDGWRGWL